MTNKKKATKKKATAHQTPAGSESSKHKTDRQAKYNKEKAGVQHGDLGRQLAAAGLQIKTVAADGNCFFRAAVDQLEGAKGDHMALRLRAVSFMREHEEDFAPYMEDEEDFQVYCSRMEKDGTWAGQQELVALSRSVGFKIAIFQASQPCWTLHPSTLPQDAPTMWLSYHEQEHYNSVRLASDLGTGPPEPIRLSPHGAGPAPAEAAEQQDGGQTEERVMQGTGCRNAGSARQALCDAGGDVDQAIELLIERLALEDAREQEGRDAAPSPPQGADAGTSSGDAPATMPEEAAAELEARTGPIKLDDGEADADREGDQTSVSLADKLHPGQQPQKGPLRNRPCPCGSGRKYKQCCLIAERTKLRRKQGSALGSDDRTEGAAVHMQTLLV